MYTSTIKQSKAKHPEYNSPPPPPHTRIPWHTHTHTITHHHTHTHADTHMCTHYGYTDQSWSNFITHKLLILQDNSLEAHQERMNFQRARITEVNMQLRTLVDSSEKVSEFNAHTHTHTHWGMHAKQKILTTVVLRLKGLGQSVKKKSWKVSANTGCQLSWSLLWHEDFLFVVVCLALFLCACLVSELLLFSLQEAWFYVKSVKSEKLILITSQGNEFQNVSQWYGITWICFFFFFLLPIFVEVVHPFFWRQIVDVTFFNFRVTLAATLCRQVVWTAISVEPVIDALHTCYHSSAPASFMLARELSTAHYTNATAAKSSNTSLSCLQEVSFLGWGEARHGGESFWESIC